MRGLGTISYSMYLWHFIFVWYLADWFGRSSFPILFLSTLAITALCASVTYALIERPGIRLGAALLRGRFTRPVPQLDANAA
jgi:peptidoglycan/LPS O-acetylase OafA/YrhL